MAKIPVGATIAHAYSFAFGNYLGVLKMIWMPALIGLVAGLFIQGRLLDFNAAMETGDFARAGQMSLMLLPLYLVALLLFFMQVEGATRLALGLMTKPGFYYLELGRPLWRLVGKTLLGLLILFGAALAALAAIFLLGAAFGAVGGGLAGAGLGLVIALAACAAYGALIYAAVRLFFFLSATVIAGEPAPLKRSWALGGGNFWRMFVVFLGALGPFTILLVVLMFSYFGFPPMPSPDMNPETFRLANRAWQTGMTERMINHWYVVAPVSLLGNVLFLGLAYSAQAFAYRAVTQTDGPWSSASRP